jgi:uncharacterized protein YdeI (YjbR/CyaY-like superfamily)
MAVARLEVDIPEGRVQTFCRIVGLDAEGDPLEPFLPRSLVDRVQQAAPDPAAAEPVDDCDRELGRLVVNVAVAVLGFREEPIPGGADRPAALFRHERDIPFPAPPLVVDHRLGMREHDLGWRELHTRPPGECGVEHLAQKRELVRRKIADPDQEIETSFSRQLSILPIASTLTGPNRLTSGGLPYLLRMASEEPRFFPAASAWRKWLEKNHATADELWVGFHKKASGKPSITWPESVDEALCFGWIDGVRKSIDEDSYKIRFTPRRPGSTWSLVNMKRVEELSALGRLQSAGIDAFAVRKEKRSGIYAYEQRKKAALDPEQERRFRASKRAWDFFQSQPPSYRQTASWWVISAKREETRERRLATLIKDSAAGRRIGPLTRKTT